jgi:hypothetical protein
MDLRTPDEWLAHPEYEGTVVLDPDGWDRKNFSVSWAEPITRIEFDRRLTESTIMLKPRDDGPSTSGR